MPDSSLPLLHLSVLSQASRVHIQQVTKRNHCVPSPCQTLRCYVRKDEEENRGEKNEVSESHASWIEKELGNTG
jgi:hypothetical protein